MPDVVVAAHLDEALAERLHRLADASGRTRSDLLAEAVQELVLREQAFADAVETGRAAVRAGRITSHEDVVAATERLLFA